MKNSKNLKTSNEWKQELHPNLMILDKDGWDRTNIQYSFYEEKITKEEYEQRLMESTVFTNKDYVKTF